jgi:branched-chain amino acid transport system substrate-binding protein
VFAFGDGACTDEMSKLAGQAAEGMVCSQAGLPREAASPDFVKAYTAKYGEIKQYAPYFYDGTMAMVEAMKKANSVDPAKFGPEVFNVSFKGATGQVEFDAKGDRKNAEMTIFKLQGGKVVPVAIVKNGQSTPFSAAAAAPAAAAPAAAGMPPAAPTAAPASAEPRKEEPKKEEKKK